MAASARLCARCQENGRDENLQVIAYDRLVKEWGLVRRRSTTVTICPSCDSFPLWPKYADGRAAAA